MKLHSYDIHFSGQWDPERVVILPFAGATL